MSYRDEEEEKIVPLQVGRQIIEGRVALHWGLKPWEFRQLEPDKAAELFALYQLEREIENYQASERMKISKRRRESQPKYGK